MSKDLVHMEEKKARILRMRVSGASWSSIAAAEGYKDASGPLNLVKRELRNQVSEAVDDLRAVELARLDEIQRVLWPRVLEGDLDAIDRILRLTALRARLTGMEKQTVVQDSKIEIVWNKQWGRPPGEDVEVQYTTDWKPRLEGGDFADLLPGTQDPEDPADD